MSPRWSGEILDCSMPMVLDTYSLCSYGCLYCFANFQKANVLKGYTQRVLRTVDIKRVHRIFTYALLDKEGMADQEYQFKPFIRARKIMQWGGLSDQFDENERKYGVSLQLLKLFDEIDYPLSLSTKGTWFTKDDRYMSLIAKHAHNWHFKISIISPDEEKSRRMEVGVDSPIERFQAIKRLRDLGCRVTLRYRPYMIGMSEGYKTMLDMAKEADANGMTVEYFCMEARASDGIKHKYQHMSNILGYDVWEFYMKNSKQMGYKRLSEAIKRPVMQSIRAYAHSLGLQFNCSDMFCRDLNDTKNCCGAPDDISYKGNFQNAIFIAKDKGTVSWDDWSEETVRFMSYPFVKACGFNSQSTKLRSQFYGMTMKDWIRSIWNSPIKGNSPMKGYGHLLMPDHMDDSNNIVYKWVKSYEGI